MSVGTIAAKPRPYRGQVCVLSLTVADAAPPLAETFDTVCAGPARIILVDCLELDSLGDELCGLLAATQRRLADQTRELVVVNAPRRGEVRLRAAGVHTAATKDRPATAGEDSAFGRSGRPIADELAAAIRGRDIAVASLDLLEAEGTAIGDRMLAARDRVAAADDRYLAAVDRLQAGIYLEQSRRDELTGTLQRRAGLDLLTREIDRAERMSWPVVVAFIDVDHLKAVNDAHGHLAGDAVLAATGRALQFGLRSYDLTMRYGGDEFVCVLPQVELAAAGDRFEALRRGLIDGDPSITITVGLAELGPGDSADDVIDRADRALYLKRARERNPGNESTAEPA